MADWVSIKAEYVATDISLRALADKHGVSFSSIGKKAMREHWRDERTEIGKKVETRVKQKLVSASVSEKVNRVSRLLTISDALAEKLEQAATELDRKLVTQKRKTKTVEYGAESAKGKPVKEVITEEEVLAVVEAPIDRLGIQQLSATLKNLHDIAKVNEQAGDDEALAKARALLGGVKSAID